MGKFTSGNMPITHLGYRAAKPRNSLDYLSMATTVKMHFEPRSAHLYQNYIFKRCFLDVIVEREKTFSGGANNPKCFLASEMAKNGIARQKHPISRRFCQF